MKKGKDLRVSVEFSVFNIAVLSYNESLLVL